LMCEVGQAVSFFSFSLVECLCFSIMICSVVTHSMSSSQNQSRIHGLIAQYSYVGMDRLLI
jgi:hypothetical protein